MPIKLRHDSIYAVLGTANSRDVVSTPTDKYKARNVRSDAKASGTSFFCSLAVGGCGNKLKQWVIIRSCLHQFMRQDCPGARDC